MLLGASGSLVTALVSIPGWSRHPKGVSAALSGGERSSAPPDSIVKACQVPCLLRVKLHNHTDLAESVQTGQFRVRPQDPGEAALAPTDLARRRTSVAPSPWFPQPQGKGLEKSRRPLTGLDDGPDQPASNSTPALTLRALNSVGPKTNTAHTLNLDGLGKRKALHRRVPEPESTPHRDSKE